MTGKNFKVFGVRGSLIGDSIMALPVLNWLERRWPGCYKHWQIARKCSQAAPIYFNHPLIDRIVISDCNEGMGHNDKALAAQCDVIFDLMPQHPEGDVWPNRRNIYEESFMMAALPLADYRALPEDERRPKLVRWWDTAAEARLNTIAFWPFAGYAKEPRRSPSAEWYNALIHDLAKRGFETIQFGHPNDPLLRATHDMRALSFFDQVKATVGCSLVVSTDSGSGLIFGAYGMDQVTLLTNHWPGHVDNPLAFAPLNPKGRVFFAANDASLIDRAVVAKHITDLLT